VKVVYFGAFDERASPRVRLLKRGLELAGVEVAECRADGRVVPRWTKLAARMPAAARGADLILVGKPGQREMPLAAALARALRLPLAVDYFASLWLNEVVERKRVAPRSFGAWKLRALDRFAWRAADLCLVDTLAHGGTIARTLALDPSKMRRVFVGAEEAFLPRASVRRGDEPLEALFVGTFIPFHGVETILEAAALLRDEPRLRITLLGAGQTRAAMVERARALALPNVRFEEPLPYEELPDRIARADLCLGLFASSPTARSVIPKKVFAALACGKPVVTADGPGIREALDEETALLVPPEDPAALADALRRICGEPRRRAELAARGRALHERRFAPAAIGASCRAVLEELVRAGERAASAAPAPVPEHVS
jgi:glycosyltransferase involved in cell wall biosynthesis